MQSGKATLELVPLVFEPAETLSIVHGAFRLFLDGVPDRGAFRNILRGVAAAGSQEQDCEKA
jgi:hypothetical protein